MIRRLLATVLLACAAGCATQDRQDAKFTEGAGQGGRLWAEWVQLVVEGLPNHPWAGTYYFGDGLGENVILVLAPGAGFFYQRRGCLGLYDWNYGTLAVTNGTIRLSFTYRNERGALEGLAPELTPVQWGARHYLIPSDGIREFCNHVNQGWEPRGDMHGLDLLRVGDEKRPVSGVPTVPEEYRVYLLSAPVAAEITRVDRVDTQRNADNTQSRVTTVTLNAGRDKGLRVGIELVVVKPESICEDVRITRVDDTTSEGVVEQTNNDDPEPKKGWRLSTRYRWVR